MAAENKVSVKLIANLEEFTQQMRTADQAVKSFASSASESIRNMASSISQSATSSAQSLSQITSQLTAIKNASSQTSASVGALGSALSSLNSTNSAIMASLNTITSQLSAIRGASNSTSQSLQQLNNTLSNLSQTTNNTSVSFNNFTQTIINNSNSTSSAISGMVKSIAGLSGLSIGIGMLKQTAEVVSEMERMRQLMNGIMDDAQKGEAAFEWLKQMSKRMPTVDVETLSQAFIKLRSSGIDPANGALEGIVNYTIKMGRSTAEINPIIEQLAQGWRKNKLEMNDIKPLINHGIDSYALLAKATNTTTGAIQKMAHEGKIGHKEISLMLKQMENDSKGSAQAISGTLGGKWSQLMTMIKHDIDAMNQQGAFKWMHDSIDLLIAILPKLQESFRFTMNGMSLITSSFKVIFGDTVDKVDAGSKKMANDVIACSKTYRENLTVMEKATMIFARVVLGTAVLIKGAYISIEEAMVSVIAVNEKLNHYVESGLQALQDKAPSFMKGFFIDPSYKDDFVEIEDYSTRVTTRMQESAKQARKAYEDLGNSMFKIPAMPDAGAPPPVDNNTYGKDKKKKGQETALQDFNKHLAAMHLAREKELADQHRFYSEEARLENEIAFIKEKLNSSKFTGSERSQLQKRLYDDLGKQTQEHLKSEKAAMQESLNNDKLSLQEKIKIAEKIAQMDFNPKTKGQSAAYFADQKAILGYQNQINKDMETARKNGIKQQSEFDLENLEEQIEIEKEKLINHQISEAKYLADYRNFINKKYELKENELKIDMMSGDQKTSSQASLDFAKIQRQKSRELAKNSTETARMTQKPWDDAGKQIANSWSSNFDKVLKRQQSFSAAIKNTLRDLALFELKQLEQTALKKAGSLLKDLFMTKETEKAKQGAKIESEIIQSDATEEGVSKSSASKLMEMGKAIMADASQAAAGAYKAVVGIPVVGPVLAPAAAAAAFAAVTAFDVISAEGGHIVPSNVAEQPAFIHRDEKVLPADERHKNDAMYKMLKSGNFGGRGTTNNHVHNWNVQSPSNDSFRPSPSQIKRKMNKSVSLV